MYKYLFKLLLVIFKHYLSNPCKTHYQTVASLEDTVKYKSKRDPSIKDDDVDDGMCDPHCRQGTPLTKCLTYFPHTAPETVAIALLIAKWEKWRTRKIEMLKIVTENGTARIQPGSLVRYPYSNITTVKLSQSTKANPSIDTDFKSFPLQIYTYICLKIPRQRSLWL